MLKRFKIILIGLVALLLVLTLGSYTSYKVKSLPSTYLAYSQEDSKKAQETSSTQKASEEKPKPEVKKTEKKSEKSSEKKTEKEKEAKASKNQNQTKSERKTDQEVKRAEVKQPTQNTAEDKGLRGVKLDISEVKKLVSVLRDLYNEKSYKYKVLKLASKYKDEKIITNFDNFYSELQEIFKEFESKIKAKGYDLKTFSREVEALYKALIVTQIDTQWNTPSFQEKLKKLKEALNDEKFPKAKKKFVKQALEKLNTIRRAVDKMKEELSPETLKVIQDNKVEIQKELKYAK